NLFLNDATYYSDKFITPATDAAVYQSSAGWMSSPKRRKLFAVTLGVYGNAFLVPKRDQSFQIKNSDFSFFTIQNANGETISPVTVPTALGDNNTLFLVGQLDANNQIKMQTPIGVNQESIIYPYLQGSISLWKGIELVGKYSSKVKLKQGEYQVYGFGLKHNFSNYVSSLTKNKINIAALFAFSKEDINFDFLDTYTSYGNLGIDKISGKVQTYQFQISASKEWKKFELMLSSITNKSDFKYFLTGEKGQIEEIIPVQFILNERLKDIYKSKVNSIWEISGRYQFKKFYVQSSVAFGKFVNTNLSLQHEF
ncbi:DUF6588 family protein, partial [Flavobacterium sp.]|uniref:DUF6588 family protein n=1 Tax=Flavobacterium sp. TaxID=239 RepID=UPI003BCEEC67